MSIFFNIGRNPTPDFVELESQFITVSNLKGLISKKIGVKVEDMKIKNVITFVQYAPNQYVKKGSSVSIEINAKNLVDQPLKFHEIISNEHLEALMTDCRFYILKSSNEENVQKARQCSVWATTFLNQDKFKNAFQCYKHVFFLFGTNRSFQLKGLARMQSEPDKIPDKSIWNGVSNIRLGGNFKIRWIRKKPLSLTTIEKKLGPDAREEIARATDGYEPDKQIAKKVSLLFDLPSEPYYKLEELLDSKKEMKNEGNMTFFNRPNSLIASQLASVMMKNIKESANIDQIGLFDDIIPQPVIMKPPPQENEMKSEPRQRSPSPRESKNKKSKKDKKHKKKKHKHKKSKSSKKKHSRSSSSESESRSRSSSSQRSHRRHKQKHRRIQKTRH